MHVVRAIVIAGLLLSSVVSGGEAQVPETNLVLVGVTLRDPEIETGPARVTVVVDDDRIACIIDAGDPVPKGGQRIDAKGLYLIPGLWDLHTHLWQTGDANLQGIMAEIGPVRGITFSGFIHDMAAAYAAASLVVCRAGAMTVAELTAAGKPAVFIPLPSAAADHQTRNARLLVEKQAARLVPQSQLGHAALEEVVKELLADPRGLKAMGTAARQLARPEATQAIVEHILGLAQA